MLFMKSSLALFNNKLNSSIYFIMPLAEKPFGHQEIVVFTKQSIMNFKRLDVLTEQPYSIFFFKFVAHKSELKVKWFVTLHYKPHTCLLIM